MAVVKRIGPGSAFKVGGAVYALLGLIIGALFSLIGMAAGAAMPPNSMPGFSYLFGAGAIIILPICYGLLGGIMAAITAFIYNLVSGWVGGLEVDLG
jgi:hypothetical protein